MTRQFISHTLSVFATQTIVFAATFLSNIILARTLGTVGKGQVTLLVTFTFLLSLSSGLGIGPASVYYLSRNAQDRASIASAALWMQGLLTFLVLIPVAVLAPWIAKNIFREEVSQALLLVALATLPFTTLVGAISNLLIGLNNIVKANYIRLLQVGVQLALFGLFIIGLRLGTGGAIVAIGLSAAGATILGFHYLKQCGVSLGFPLTRNWIRDLLSYGLKSWFGNILQYFNYRLDIFIINLFATAASVGQYSVAVGMAEMIWYLPTAVSVVLFPRTASDLAAATRFTPLVARNTLFVTAAAATGMALISFPLIPWVYGQAFVPAVEPLLILLPGIVCLGVGKVIASDLAGRGKPHYGTWSALVALVLTVGFDLLLIPRWDSRGAALASTISYAFSTGILLFLYVRLSGNPLRSILLLQRSDLQEYVSQLKKYAARR